MAEKIAVVTGANKGLGFSIVKGLCQTYPGKVYLTSRNEKLGKEAVKTLNEIGLKPEYHILDVTDKRSVKDFAGFLKEKHGGIDALVNNAGILEWDQVYPTYEAANRNIECNYKSLLTMEEFIFPLLRDGSRVVNISSACGHLSNLRKEKWIELLQSKDLTVEQLNSFVDEYLESVKNGTFNKDDFADDGKHAEHRVSKIAVTALTMILDRKYSKRNISINAVHPGNVKTDMANGGGTLEPDEAAKPVLYLILEASPNLRGVFMWHDRKLVDWFDAEGDYYLKGLW